MSLEAKIEELIAAVNANTEALKAAGTAAPASAGNTQTDEGAGEKRGRGRPKKEEAEKTETKPEKAETKVEAVTDDKVREVFGAFMGVDDADEREKRKDFVKGVLKAYGVSKALEIPADKRAEEAAGEGENA